MLHVTAIIRVQPGHMDAVREALVELASHSRAEAGCLRYAVFLSHTEPALITHEEWVDAAAEAAHLHGPNVAAAFERVGRLLAAPPEIHRCELLVPH